VLNNLNKFYFNHIPKTGGRFISDIIVKSDSKKIYQLAPKEKININRYNASDVITGHLGIEPNKIYSNINTIVCLRDPIKRLVSHYCEFTKLEKDNGIEDFKKWLFDDSLDIDIKSNYQSKFFTNTRNPFILEDNPKVMGAEAKEFVRSGWGLIQDKPSYDIAKKYIDQSILVLITEKLSGSIKLLSNTLNIPISNHPDFFILHKHNNKDSDILFNSLNNKDIEKIKNMNSIDFEIYEYAKSIS
jgi:hypothetical protein